MPNGCTKPASGAKITKPPDVQPEFCCRGTLVYKTNILFYPAFSAARSYGKGDTAAASWLLKGKHMKITDGQILLFTGDSITDCGRGYPVGKNDRLGDGYVALVDNLLRAGYPQHKITVLNTGISGNRVIDLQARWQQDVLQLKPHWLSMLIGINDVWRHFDSPDEPVQVDSERFEQGYRTLLVQTWPKVAGLVLMSPYYIESRLDDPMRRQMDIYGEIVRLLAAQFDAVFVDLQAAFDAYLRYRPAQSLCDDRIHPNRTGHMIIARAFLTAVQFEW